VLFVNDPTLITEEYRRFFVRQLRQRLPFSEVPIKLAVRGHHRSFDRGNERTAAGAGGGARPPRPAARKSPARKSTKRERK
jgi:hypothetical protein